MPLRPGVLALAFAALPLVPPLVAASVTAPPEPGIPIRSEAVVRACAACHAADPQGRLSRISWRRTTPEGWQETVKRMGTLNGAYLEAEQAREVVRYLSNELGLAPEEVKPARFELERRRVEFEYPNADARATCGACHSIGRAMLQRRSPEEWDLLVAMHRGYYPLVDFQAFRLPGPPQPEPGATPAPVQQPVDRALAHLKAAYPLSTPEWSAWVANRRAPRLAGRWALSGYEPGRGALYGEVTIGARPGSEDEFVTEARCLPARGGAPIVRTGQAIVYTGFQWRGRSKTAAGEPLREVLFLERDGRTLSGRWFAGAYDERGVDVSLTRIGAEALLTGVEPRAVRAGRSLRLRLFGANLDRVGAADLDLGPGVRVARVSPAAGGLYVDVEVATDAAPGDRDLTVGGAWSGKRLAVFRTVDALDVVPRAGMARIGGQRFEKGYQQFEARASSFGADGRPDTADDFDLGPVTVDWSLEEFAATVGDDDTGFVGRIDADGLFTPADDGPNPRRSGSRNNVGDVWVVASLPTTSALAPATPLRARAHLIVTVPLYARWDQPEVSP